MTAPEEVSAAIDEHKPGDSIEVTYYRGNDKKTATVKLGERPSDSDTGGCGTTTTEP